MTIKYIDTENITPEMIEAFRYARYIDSGLRAALEVAPVVKESLATDHAEQPLEMVDALNEAKADVDEWKERERCVSEHYAAACKSIDELSIENERLVAALQKEVNSPTFMGEFVIEKPIGYTSKYCLGVLSENRNENLVVWREKVEPFTVPLYLHPSPSHFVDAAKLVEKIRATLPDTLLQYVERSDYRADILGRVIGIVEGEV